MVSLYVQTASSLWKSSLDGLASSHVLRLTLSGAPKILLYCTEYRRPTTLPDGMKFQMPTYGSGNNKEYLVQVIDVLRLIEQMGTAAEVKEALAALVNVRKEMSPFFNFPEDETPAKKEARKKKLANLNKSLKAKKSFAVNQAQNKLFICFVVGWVQMQWDRIVNKMHTKNPWIGINGKSNKGIRVKSWISFMDCTKLHKLTVFPAEAAEKQHYYMQQTIKKPQQVTVCQFMSRMGVLNNYLAYLPMVFDSLMAIAGTKKVNVPFDEADLARIVLNSVPYSWVNQYNMTHSTLPKNPRALLNNQEAIKQVVDEKHNATLKVKAKEATAASAAAKGSSKKHPASRNSGELRVPKKARPSRFCQHCKAKGRSHLTHNTKEYRRYNGNGNPVSSFQGKPANAKKPAKKGGNQQMAYLTAAVESLVKKGLKKAMKGKK
jgi:hypothetical protein